MRRAAVGRASSNPQLPTAYDNGNGYGSPQNGYGGSKGRRNSGGSFGSNARMALWGASVLFFCTTLYYRSKANGWYGKLYPGSNSLPLEEQLREKTREYADVQKLLKESHGHYDVCEKDYYDVKAIMEDLRARLEEKKEKHEDLKDRSVDMWHDHEVTEHVEDRESAIWDRVHVLRKHMQREAHREVIERFGPGPHKVAIDVQVPYGDGNVKQFKAETIMMELAPLRLMPHAVHLFLEQIYHGLWNGCDFVINGIHVLQAGPGDDKQLEAFQHSQLDVLSFQEYHKEFPHEKYTVGFAGRPGGPDFYINKRDNTEYHGPYGQPGYDLEEEADPCFGRIVSGFDTLARLWTLPAMDDEAGFWLHEKVHISSMKILGPQPAPPLPDSNTVTNNGGSGGGAAMDEEYPHYAHHHEEMVQHQQTDQQGQQQQQGNFQQQQQGGQQQQQGNFQQQGQQQQQHQQGGQQQQQQIHQRQQQLHHATHKAGEDHTHHRM